MFLDSGPAASRRPGMTAESFSSLPALLLYAGPSPFVPAEAGTQFLQQSLGPRVRGGERCLDCGFNINHPR